MNLIELAALDCNYYDKHVPEYREHLLEAAVVIAVLSSHTERLLAFKSYRKSTLCI